MKLKLYKKKNGEWSAGMFRGNGGISSLLIVREGKSFWRCISIFLKPKNYYKHLI